MKIIQSIKLTIFLGDDNEEHELPPNEDLYWLKTTFSDIRKVIKDALIEKKGLIPLRERSFIEQYLENLPPLAPEGKLEKLNELTHVIFGNYSKGIEYANMHLKKVISILGRIMPSTSFKSGRKNLNF